MHRHLTVLIALGLTGCPKASTAPPPSSGLDNAAVPPSNTSPPGGDVTLRWRPDPVGYQYVKAEVERVAMMYGETPITVETTKVRHLEVLESDAFVTRIAVRWDEHHEAQTINGMTTTLPAAVEGKRYLVWQDGGETAASLEDGSAISPDELEEIDKAVGEELGAKPGIVQMLLRRAWKMGETVELGPQDLVDLSRDLSDDATVEAAAATLQSVDGTSAVFAMTMDVKTSGKAAGRVEAEMTFTVDTDPLRPTAIEGQLHIDMNVDGTRMTGKGLQSIDYTYE